MFQVIKRALRETWFFWLFFLVVAFMTGRESETWRIPPRANFLIGFNLAVLASFWVVLDSRRRGQRMGYDYPALVFLIWPIFAPIYLFQSRGLRAFLSLLAFIAVLFITSGIGVGIGVMTR